MFEKMKGNILFHSLLKRPNIDKAYAMVGPEDSWYDTITTVHNSLAEIRKLPHETLNITSDDGLNLEAIYYPGESDKTVIWIHGYTSHAERESAFPGLFYHSLGFNVLIPYLRAHGPSEGKYISLGPKEADDIALWIQKINDIHPNGKIHLHGLSMGGGIALDLASRELANVKCMVVDAPSVTVADIFYNVAKHVFKRGHEAVASATLARYEKEFGCSALGFDRCVNIASGKYPILLTAGSNEQMEDALNEVKSRNPMQTTILILPGCNHGNGMYKQTQLYQSAIKAFLKANMDEY